MENKIYYTVERIKKSPAGRTYCIRSSMETTFEMLVSEEQYARFDIKEGDIIGLDESHIKAKSETIEDTLLGLIENLVSEDSVNITLFYGAGIKDEAAKEMEQKVANRFSQCEVTSIYGGQPVYYYVVSVE